MRQHATSFHAHTRNLWFPGRTAKAFSAAAYLLLGSCCVFAQTGAGTKIAVSAHAVVNFEVLAQQEKLHPTVIQQQAVAVPQAEHMNLPVPPGAATIRLTNRTGRNATSQISSASGPAVASPQSLSPSPFSPGARLSFAGTSDNQLRIPPGPSGAVSPTYLVETVNGTFTVQNRTGGVLQTVFMDNFWAAVGGVTGAVNARVVYDPYNSRWIMAAEANANTINSVLLIGVSQNSNPTSTWNLFKVNSDSGSWANFPTLGFNANWIAVSMNMFQIGCSSKCFQQENIYVFNKAQLYANTLGTVTKFTDATSGAQTYMPAVTFDNSATTPLYLLQKWNENFNGAGFVRLGSITGTPPSPPSINFQVSFAGFGPWAFTGGITNGGFAPQAGNSTLIDTLDDRMQSLTYRDGFLWGAQTVFLPASTPTHSSVLWYAFDPTNTSNVFYDFIDDPTGNEFRAYPSIAVNKFDDALIGYSTFSAGTYASAAYSFSSHRDTESSEPEQLLHSGLGPYVKFYSSANAPNTTNYWGFYSGAAVDPTNDTDLWTLQEFANPNVGSTGDFGRWGTWWGMVQIANTKFVVNPNPGPVTAGQTFSMNVTAEDNSSFAVTGYGGTVHFTSADATAVLPADYTFTETDQGFHAFTGLVLHKAGNPSITITDTATSVALTVNIQVNAAAMSGFQLTAPASTTAGSAFSVTATASDPYNNTISGYSGTVKFTSSDPAAVLPGNYTFVPGTDLGVHTFTGVVLKTAGTKSITVADTVTSSLAGTAQVNVSPAGLNHLGVVAPPTASTSYPFNFTVAAQDQFNNTVPSYLGTVQLTSSGVAATIQPPTTYTFVAGDQGVHGFSATVTGAAPATLTLTATDSGNAVNGSTNVAVVTDLPLTLRGRRLRFRLGLPFTMVVADLTDTDTGETGSNLSATINWGDGTPSAAATLISRGGGVFQIQGSHRYLSHGAFSISVQANDSAGFQTTGIAKATMGPKPSSF